MNEEIKKLLEEILSSVRSLEKRIAQIEGVNSMSRVLSITPPTSTEKKTSIKEFLIEKVPKGSVDMTLAIGYFLETYEGISPFNKADLDKGFRNAKEALPQNVNDKVNLCIKKGYLMEAEEKKDSMKAWVLTRSGEQYVEEDLPVKKQK